MTTIGILHPGSMGAAVAAEAAGRATVLWCSQGRSKATADRASRYGLTAVEDLEELAIQSEVILSICPPANAEEVARSIVALSFSGIYVEANAISPEKVKRIHEMMERAGATLVDGAIIGSPPSPNRTSRLLLAGNERAMTVVTQLFQGTQATVHTLSGGIGSASALKLAYSSYQKASRVLAALAYAFATDHGVEGDLLDIASGRTVSYLGEPQYFPTVAARAWRWAPEMREIADALAASELPPELAEAAANVMDRWTSTKDRPGTIDEALALLRRA